MQNRRGACERAATPKGQKYSGQKRPLHARRGLFTSYTLPIITHQWLKCSLFTLIAAFLRQLPRLQGRLPVLSHMGQASLPWVWASASRAVTVSSGSDSLPYQKTSPGTRRWSPPPSPGRKAASETLPLPPTFCCFFIRSILYCSHPMNNRKSHPPARIACRSEGLRGERSRR